MNIHKNKSMELLTNLHNNKVTIENKKKIQKGDTSQVSYHLLLLNMLI